MAQRLYRRYLSLKYRDGMKNLQLKFEENTMVATFQIWYRNSPDYNNLVQGLEVSMFNDFLIAQTSSVTIGNRQVNTG